MDEKIREILKIFQKINPILEFNNQHKKVIEFIVNEFDFEKIKKIANYAVSVQGEKYAPVITDPIQLKNKLGQLIVYAKRQQSNRPVII